MWSLRIYCVLNALKGINDAAKLELEMRYKVYEYTPVQAFCLLAKLLGLVVSLRPYGNNDTSMYLLTIEKQKNSAFKANPKPFSLCEREKCFMEAFYFYENYFVSNEVLLSNSDSLKRSLQNYVTLSLTLFLIGAKVMTSENEKEEEREKIKNEFGLSNVENCDKSSHTEGPPVREEDSDVSDSDSD